MSRSILRRRAAQAAALLALTCFAGCNSGLAALFGASQSDSSNADSVVTSTGVSGTRSAPAQVRFTVVDQEGDAATLELCYQAPDGSLQPMSALVGASNPQSYASSASGTQHEVLWDYAQEAGLDADGLNTEVLVMVRPPGSDAAPSEGANAATVDLGNDPPAVEPDGMPAIELSGIALIELRVSDSSSDLVDLVIEYDVQGDSPDTGWLLARPAGADATPPVAVDDVAANPDGVPVSFFWDTLADLPSGDVQVVLRVTPTDDTESGAAVLLDAVAVDNNAPPLAVIDELNLQETSDRFGGLVVGAQVSDPESDVLGLALQWRVEGESYPELPATAAALAAALADPVQRAALKLGTPQVRELTGQLVQTAPGVVRVPAMHSELSELLGPGLVGRQLEVLPNAQVSLDLAERFPALELSDPAAAVPTADGRAAAVLDRPSGGWRLRLVDLGSGGATDLASGTGNAIALRRFDESWIVAAELGGGWSLTALAGDGAAIASGTGPGTLRDFAPLTARVVFATIDDAVVRVALPDTGAELATIVSGLAEPWGIALDPFDGVHAFVAERGGDRVMVVNLRYRYADELPAELREPGVALPAPHALAIDRNRKTLFVVCEPKAGNGELRARSLNRVRSREDGSEGPLVDSVRPLAPSARLAAGPEGQMLVAAGGSVAIVGGPGERRTIVAQNSVALTLTLDAPLSAPLGELRRFSLRYDRLPVRSTPGGVDARYAWATGADIDAATAEVFVRITPYDVDRGIASPADFPIDLDAPSGLEYVDLGLTGGPSACDLDRDGDVDLALGADEESFVALQGPRGEFTPVPGTIAFEPPGTNPLPVGPPTSHILPVDLDRDGRVDLLAQGPGGVLASFQQEDGSFPATPVLFADPAGLEGPYDVLACDLEGDGELELLTTYYGGVDSGAVVIRSRTGPLTWEPSLVLHLDSLEPRSVNRARLTEPLDVDADGDLDLFVVQGEACNGNPICSFSYFEQLEPGVFASELSFLYSQSGEGKTLDGIRLTDLDEDGQLDLVSLHGPSTSFPTFPNDLHVWHHRRTAPLLFDWLAEGLPYFPAAGGGASFVGPSALEFPDFDGDGRYDLLIEDAARTRIQRDGSSPFGGQRAVDEVLFSPYRRWLPGLVDVEGDGDLDVVGMREDDTLVRGTWLTSPARGALDWPETAEPLDVFGPAQLFRTFEVIARDVDGDGDLDLVAAVADTSTFLGSGLDPVDSWMEVLLQTAPREFSHSQQLLTYVDGNCVDVETGDMDGDGDLDLVSVSWDGWLDDFFAPLTTSSVQLHRQVAPGVFEDPAWVDLGGFGIASDVELVDLDLDGDLDIAASVRGGVTTFLQDAGGEFQQDHVDGGSELGLDIGLAVADVDGNGLPDLVSGPLLEAGETYGDVPITVSYQTAPGAWAPTALPGVSGPAPRALLARDLDGDGRCDIAWTEGVQFGADVALRIALQTAPGTFELRRDSLSISELTYPSFDGLEAVDLDHGGDLDLVVGTLTGVRVYTQTVPGRFDFDRAVGTTSSFSDRTSVTIVDLDGDGALDLVAVGEAADTGPISVYWGGDRQPETPLVR